MKTEVVAFNRIPYCHVDMIMAPLYHVKDNSQNFSLLNLYFHLHFTINVNSAIRNLTTDYATISIKIKNKLDDDIFKKLCEKHAKLNKKSTKSVSFSSVVNEEIRKSLK